MFANVADKSKPRAPKWTLTLSLLEDSEGTYVHSRFLIQAVIPPNETGRGSSRNLDAQTARPALKVILRTRHELISVHAKRRRGQKKKIVASLNNFLLELDAGHKRS